MHSTISEKKTRITRQNKKEENDYVEEEAGFFLINTQ